VELKAKVIAGLVSGMFVESVMSFKGVIKRIIEWGEFISKIQAGKNIAGGQ